MSRTNATCNQCVEHWKDGKPPTSNRDTPILALLATGSLEGTDHHYGDLQGLSDAPAKGKCFHLGRRVEEPTCNCPRKHWHQCTYAEPATTQATVRTIEGKQLWAVQPIGCDRCEQWEADE
ncbi:hypothetical protein [Planctomycetes bacterium Pan216]